MLFKDVKDMIDDIGLPNAYYAFPEGTETAPPFICFWYPQSDDIYADNSNYVQISNLQIELYTDKKDPSSEKQVEDVLRENNITWAKDETEIEAELMHMVRYSTEVILEYEEEDTTEVRLDAEQN